MQTRIAHHRRRQQPRGFTLLELMLSLTLLGLFAAMAAPLLMSSARERRTSLQEQLALQLAANQLEHLTIAPPASTDGPQSVPIPDEFKVWLPGVEQNVTITSSDDGQRLAVSITWQQRPGLMHKPVVLEGWAFPTGGRP